MADTTTLDLPDMAMAGLRQYRETLAAEEDNVSYWRRVLHGRIDLLTKATDRADGQHPGWLVGTDELASVLKDTATGHSRRALMKIAAPQDLPELPGLDQLWARDVDPTDQAAVTALLAALTEAVGRVDRYRALIHERIDAATAELVFRYKDDPDACLDLID